MNFFLPDYGYVSLRIRPRLINFVAVIYAEMKSLTYLILI